MSTSRPATREARCVDALIEIRAQLAPTSVAVEAPGRRPLTNEMLHAHVLRVGQSLSEMGIGRGDCVATILPNGPEAATAFLAVSAHTTCAPLNPDYAESEFAFYLSDLNPKAVLVRAGDDSPALSIAREHGIPILRMQPLDDEPAGPFALSARNGGTRRSAAGPEDVALILHTSGTTSRPKMVPLTHANLIASASAIVRTLGLTAADRCLNVMPLFHIHGLVCSVLASMSGGGSLICTPGFFATDFPGWLKTLRPTWYSAVPTMHQAILRRVDGQVDHSLRLIRSSSAALPPDVAVELERVFGVPVIESYGMTEASHQMTSNPRPPAPRKAGSVGPAAGPMVAVMDGTGAFVDPRVKGEIVIRGESVTSGYAGNPDANRLAFTGGWFRTGDQGYLDDEGYLFITGRIKELINRGGEKIAPREIDEVLLSHPAVRQAVAFAVPDPVLGEDVAVAVILGDEADVTEMQLRTFAATRLAPFKVPTTIVFVDEIPKGPTGKLQRIGLADRLGVRPAERPENGFVAPATPLEARLAGIWSDVLAIRQVGVRTHFLDLGGDSMLATRLVSRIRGDLGLEISMLELFDAPTVTEQAALVARHRPEAVNGR